VIAVVASPPEVAPGDSLDLEIDVIDPDDGPRDVIAWFCTPWNGTCAEATPPDRPLSAFGAVWKDAALIERARLTVPDELATLLPPDAGSQPVVQWTLACRPGLCPVIDAAAAAPPAGSAAWHEVVDLLAAPGGMMRELPLTGVSLAVKTMLVSSRPQVERTRNPSIELRTDDELVVTAGDVLDLSFDVGDGTVHAYTTAGAFTDPTFGARGETIVRWYTPSLPGAVDLVVVIEDGVGGTGVWRAIATVR
jgi:hypothetical protein